MTGSLLAGSGPQSPEQASWRCGLSRTAGALMSRTPSLCPRNNAASPSHCAETAAWHSALRLPGAVFRALPPLRS